MSKHHNLHIVRKMFGSIALAAALGGGGAWGQSPPAPTTSPEPATSPAPATQPQDDVERLVAALTSRSPAERRAAAAELAELAEGDRAILLRLSQRSEPAVAAAAMSALLGGNWIEDDDGPVARGLLQQYGQLPPAERIRVAYALAQQVDPRERAAAARLIAKDPDPSVGFMALAALRSDTETLAELQRHPLASQAEDLPALDLALGYAEVVDDPHAAAARWRKTLTNLPEELSSHLLAVEVRRTLIMIAEDPDTAWADANLRAEDHPVSRADRLMLAAAQGRDLTDLLDAAREGTLLEQAAAEAVQPGEGDALPPELAQALRNSPREKAEAMQFLVHHGKDRTAMALARVHAEHKQRTAVDLLDLALAADGAGNPALAYDALQQCLDLGQELPPMNLGGGTYISRLHTNGLLKAVADKDEAKAQEHLEALLPLNDLGTDEAIAMSNYLVAHGRQEEADKVFNRVYGDLQRRMTDDADPTHANNMAWLLVETDRDLEQAADLAESAVAAEPFSAPSLDTLAVICFKRGDVTRAIKLERRALLSRPGDPFMMKQLARFQGE